MPASGHWLVSVLCFLGSVTERTSAKKLVPLILKGFFSSGLPESAKKKTLTLSAGYGPKSGLGTRTKNKWNY